MPAPAAFAVLLVVLAHFLANLVPVAAGWRGPPTVPVPVAVAVPVSVSVSVAISVAVAVPMVAAPAPVSVAAMPRLHTHNAQTYFRELPTFYDPPACSDEKRGGGGVQSGCGFGPVRSGAARPLAPSRAPCPSCCWRGSAAPSHAGPCHGRGLCRDLCPCSTKGLSSTWAQTQLDRHTA